MKRPYFPRAGVMLAVSGEVERAGLRLLVEDEGFSVIGEAPDGHSALAFAEQLEPDIVIVDSCISDVPTLALVHRLTRACPGVQVLIYTEGCGRDWLKVALGEGVRGFILKTRVAGYLGPALRALSARRPYWLEAVQDELLDELLNRQPASLAEPLTSREWQVLEFSAQDRSIKDVARTLGISPRTVATHRTSLRRKLGIGSRYELVRIAEERAQQGVAALS